MTAQTTAGWDPGALAGSTRGVIHQLNVSDGGVPKLPVPDLEIAVTGISGDRQRNRRVHGGPQRAVCLFSLDVIESLRADGHPIAPGSVGENVTVAGLDWSLVQPGTRLRLGDAVLLEVTKFTTPCINITESFSDGNYTRLFEGLFPHQSRVYARVLAPGRVRAGDVVEIEA
jgi:MOSC domain-containing protein YiiM